jgi:hypothetical protein
MTPTPTPTPRTDAEILQVPSCFENTYHHVVLADFARQLERELNDANEQLHKVRIRCSEWADVAGKRGAEVDVLLEALESMVAANGGIAVMPTIEARNQNAALMKAKAAITKVKGKP